MKQKKQIEKMKSEEERQLETNEEEEEVEYEYYTEDVEEFADYMSEELVTAYHILKDWVDSMGLPLLEHCTFPDFVEFCYRYSSGRKPVC